MAGIAGADEVGIARGATKVNVKIASKGILPTEAKFVAALESVLQEWQEIREAKSESTDRGAVMLLFVSSLLEKLAPANLL